MQEMGPGAGEFVVEDKKKGEDGHQGISSTMGMSRTKMEECHK